MINGNAMVKGTAITIEFEKVNGTDMVNGTSIINGIAKVKGITLVSMELH